jgi:molybdate transport system substrate-binding protein
MRRSPGAGGSSRATSITGVVTVLAAAPLTEASFTTLGNQFESEHPGSKVKLSFGAGSDLAEQINQGAPADVFASASTKNMQQVISAGGATVGSRRCGIWIGPVARR